MSQKTDVKFFTEISIVSLWLKKKVVSMVYRSGKSSKSSEKPGIFSRLEKNGEIMFLDTISHNKICLRYFFIEMTTSS